jgi:type I restriction enzyme S subunit
MFEIKKRISGEEGFDVLSITQRGIKIKDTESNDGQLSMDYGKYQFVYPGDFAMNHMDLLTGYVDISKYHGVTSPDYRVFAIKDAGSNCAAYFLYVFQMCYQQKIFFPFGQGSSQLGRWRLPTDEFNNFILPRPPLVEQQAIAAFLDRETAKIDALVEEQRRLIELLKEKRQAVISHAVTKGLDPTAPMKGSGVEWLGEVPAHWSIGPMKRIATVLPGFAFSSAAFSMNEEHDRLLRGVNVAVGGIRWDETVFWARKMDDGLDAFELHPGDVVLGMDRPWIGDGLRVAKIGVADVPALLLQRVAAVRPRADHNSDFLFLALSHPAFFHHCAPEMTGVSVPHISASQIGDYVVAVPPKEEQAAIAAFVALRLREFDELGVEAEAAINLLQERRAALISAAVTGKIDVRGLAQAEIKAA